MADMYETTCSSSSTPAEADEISMFLHQILLRSSTSSLPSPSIVPHNAKQMESYAAPPENKQHPAQSSTVYGPDRISNFGTYNVSSSSVGTFENDTDEYDCESQEGFEALGEEAPKVKATSRNSSKRGRAAEVHNMSEKRRRSRINEKMKALQNLIPNSNKTDKASMLDEAIEYLKQLQLQVQMLTMRNGLSLYPMCLPGVIQADQLSQARMGLYQGNGPSNVNMTGHLPEILTNPLFTMHNQCTSLPNITNAKTSFGLESLAQAQLGPFQLHTSDEEIRREDLMPYRQLKNLECNQIVSPRLESMHPRGPFNGDSWRESLQF